MALTKTELAFLEERVAAQESLRSQISGIQKQIDDYDGQLAELQFQIQSVLDQQRLLTKQKRQLVEASGIVDLSRELSDVAKDVTKLLRKKRGA